jgi:hypothetical protein
MTNSNTFNRIVHAIMQSQGLDLFDIIPSAHRPQGKSVFLVTDRPLSEVLRSGYGLEQFEDIKFRQTPAGVCSYYIWQFFQRRMTRENMNYKVIDTYMDYVGHGKFVPVIPVNETFDA